MLATQKCSTHSKQLLNFFLFNSNLQRRSFAKYSSTELRHMKSLLDKKFRVLQQFTNESTFDYEPPQMQFDRKTGEIKILEKKDDNKKEKKIVQNLDELTKERSKLYKELGLDERGRNTNEKENVDKYAEKLKIASDRMQAEFEIDPSGFYVFSRDDMRVDCGLMIQRPPIFMTMRKREVEFLKYKNHLMNEYYMDQRQYFDELEDAVKLNEEVLNDNPYKSRMNLDNYPTYKLTNEETGEELEYAAASKHFSKTDPNILDRRTIHYAGEDRTYLILKNKYTKEWEFPTTKMYFGETFLKAKQNLFTNLTSDEWKIRFFGQNPVVSTIRELSGAEKQDSKNQGLNGVRTYFFQANHYRGLPSFNFESDHSEHEDYAWVPKRQLNEYFDRDYFDIFINATLTR